MATEAANKANKAGKAYKEFLKREAKSASFFTGNQQTQRKRSFLESHVSIFDAYAAGVQNDNWRRGLTAEGVTLARDIAWAFPDSQIGRKVNQNVAIRERGGLQERNILNENQQAEIDIQGKAFENYQNRMQYKAVTDTERLENARPLNDGQEEYQKQFSNDQLNGIRDICAYMYRHTKTHQKFVDGIAARPTWEKLLMFYIVENNKIHNLKKEDVERSQSDAYVPSLERFKERVWYSKHWYKLGAKDINWNMLSDAANTAFRGLYFSSDKENEKQQEEESIHIQTKNDILPNVKDQEKEEADDFGNGLSFDKDEIIVEGGGEPEDFDKDLFNDSAILVNAQEKMSRLSGMAANIRDSVENGADSKQIENDAQMLFEFMNEITVDFDLPDMDAALRQELKSGAPGGGSGMKALNTELAYRTKYVGLMRSGLGLGQSALKSVLGQRAMDQEKALYPGGRPEGAPKPTGAFKGSDSMTQYSTYAGLAIDAPMTLISVLDLCIKVGALFSDWKHIKKWDRGAKLIELLSSTASTGKSGISATTTAGSVIGNASWGSAGQSAMATTLKTTAGYLGIASGGLTAFMGIYQVGNIGSKRSKLTEIEGDFQREGARLNDAIGNAAGEEKAKLQEKKERNEGKNQMVMNIIAANRSSLKNKQKTAGLQIVQGGLTAASGTLTMMAAPSLGLTGIAALALSGASLSLSVLSAIIKKKGKGVEIKDVIDNYIGMDGLYNNYVSKNWQKAHVRSRDAYVNLQGGAEKIRDKIRMDVIGALGFPSMKKFYAEIMYQYAQLLYNTVFYKGNRMAKISDFYDVKKKGAIDQERYNYARLLEFLVGGALTFGTRTKNPWPSVEVIYKKLIG
ncbi:MAG: hypothetical protein Q4A32_09210 [Lachnospiraceae bacterium]|nr:hypothetical protein [Lachnospiraceae bacterium]